MSLQLFDRGGSWKMLYKNSTRKIDLVQIKTNVKLDAMTKLSLI